MKNKTVTIQGGTLNLSEISEFQVLGNLTFKNTKLVVNGTTIYANGNELVVSNDVTFDGTVSAIYGGGKENASWSTNLTLLAGNYTEIYGGSNGGVVLGDTNVTVGGNVNSGITVSDHSIANRIYGGGYNAVVSGDTHVTIQDSAQTSVVYGGGNGVDSKVSGTCYVNANGGNVMGYYGGSYQGVVSNTVLNMTAGTAEQIFGGCQLTSMTGDVNVTITGGTITRRIYGGCYNEADVDLFSTTYYTEFFVTGNTTVHVGGTANYTHSGSLESAICAGSRHNKNHAEENAVLDIETNTLYENLESYIGSSLLEIDPGYDTLYVAGVKK